MQEESRIIYISIVISFVLISCSNFYIYTFHFTTEEKGVEAWIDDVNISEDDSIIEIHLNFTIKNLYGIQVPFMYYIYIKDSNNTYLSEYNSIIIDEKNEESFNSLISSDNEITYVKIEITNGEFFLNLKINIQ
jgi:hypothetical protein